MISTVYIAKNVYGGDGLGRLGDGRVIFVPNAFAGENVKAEIVVEKRNFVKARLIEVVEPSADRIASGAAVPGMVYAELSVDGELKAKRDQLAEFFERARIPVPEIKVMTGGPVANYRNKVVYHFARCADGWRIGYREEPSHEIVDVKEDPLAADAINAQLGRIRSSVMMLLTQGPVAVRRETERKGSVTIRWSERSGVRWWIGDAPADMTLMETTCGKMFEVPAGGFYQVNPAVGETLVRSVVDEYDRIRAEAPRVLDLYCGVGVFGICMKPDELVGVESGRQAIESARRNASGMNARFHAEQVGRNLRRIPIGRDTCVVIDPPRGGLEPRVPEWLANSPAPYIFYVSCDPATMMRDLRVIARRYDVMSVRLFNMFPRTARFETLVVLHRR